MRPTSVHASARRAASACLLALWAASAHGAPQTIQVINFEGQPQVGAAVSVMVRGTRPAAPPGTLAEMGQRQRAFVPALLVVQTGTAVNFPNFDTVRHHVYSFSPTKPFEIKLYAGTPAAPVVFDKAGTATLGCNIHDRMLAHIHVVDTPFFGVTDALGRVTIDVPDGEHRVRVWMPAMGEGRPGVEQALRTASTPVIVRLAAP
ncbi:methylamine utilization protein [Aquabacterium fontiphilum]|jgi:plastocyanin|uniref:methylamine utilization protein n=1 Tax=Aquabacterium fontiphilum TaxID=450365 RepID=UPI001378C79A|nr:methylamine utilization protein [Aquabacterium fontiphilum]NBD22059.1 methylamine utilization protein [Aquabacterium fontiphilum]